MNLADTIKYYRLQAGLTQKDLADYLDALGADIEKPFEAVPAGVADGMMLYSGVQYVILGETDDFVKILEQEAED